MYYMHLKVLKDQCFNDKPYTFQIMIFHVKQGPFVEEFYQCVTYGFYTAEWQEHLYTVFTLICGFLLPLFILVTTYVSAIKIYLHFLKF